MLKIDAHTHFGQEDTTYTLEQLYDKMLHDMELNHIDKFVIQVTDRIASPEHFRLASGLWFKMRHPEKVFLFGGLRFEKMRESHGADLLTQLDALRQVGCDGLKLLIGKPDTRKLFGEPLDSPLLTPLFSELEKSGFPITFHIADPAEFWSFDTVPLWAQKNNWWYDAANPGYDQIKAEAGRLFERHPGLNLILAHFFFMSQDLENAAKFLDEHPNIRLDLSPGIEMYHNFSAKRNEARDFFIRYADRLIFGSDAGMFNHMTSLGRIGMIAEWLETDHVIPVPEDDPCMMPDTKDEILGIGLPETELHKIFGGNFIQSVGHFDPLPVDPVKAKHMFEELHKYTGGGDVAASLALETLF